ncbi:hypothetical protein QYE77_15005 (plasmid) [Thermanaerothrix sp. 4228-RoL]|uniref:Uncharacterized protein n=1 Tax=Thermanaerothrix solaris TaxID=3058434 RepID=A0ABU3NRX1_9CHLR|nr:MULTISPECIES: hypothetical protein [unclassified Thermanaerothrix]MDT8899572.1 hypothetical protein [Thermanaerothrix sp. 4228-RoL]
MGLDNIWYNRNGEKTYLEFNPELNLVGGLFSEHGNGSFRGGYYNDFFVSVLGFDLHNDLSNSEVRQIAERLNSMNYDPSFLEEYDITPEEFEDLRRMFTAYGKAGCHLEAWY